MNTDSLINKTFGKDLLRLAIDNESILFVAKDVCETLGYNNPREAVRKHCKNAIKRDTPTPGGNQNVTFIPESDVYRLIMRSKLPDAEKFQDWVCNDVLPSIRKSGAYVGNDPSHVMVETTGDQFRDFMKAMEMVYMQAKEAAEKTEQLNKRAAEIEEKAVLMDKQLAEIEAGSLPVGWNTIGELARMTGISKNKSLEIIAAYAVPKKKIAQASDQRVTHVTVASEEKFLKAVELVKSESEKMGDCFYKHAIIGRFSMKEKAL